METPAQTFDVPLESIAFDTSEMARLLGYPSSMPDAVAATIDELTTKAFARVQPVGGYRCFPADIDVDRRSFRIGDTTFQCGALICRHLKGGTGIAAFVATLGAAFETWSKHFFDERDPYQGYLSDAIGSVLVESAVDWLEQRLKHEIGGQGMKCSNRLSPGYCNWSVDEQHKLFGLMPERFCGVTLTDSALMIPTKSVSGVIGIGPDLVRQDYGCKVCSMEDCIMQRP